MLSVKNSFLLLLLMLTLVTKLKAQNHYFKHFQVEDGLAHNTVSSILQDKMGFMWFGTKGCLNRFDGYTFKAYKNVQSESASIGNDVILSLCEDKKGMMWAGTAKGIFRYNPCNETFDEPIQMPLSVRNIIVDKKNHLWFLSGNKVTEYDQTNKKLIDHKVTGRCFVFDKNENIWIGTGSGELKHYNQVTKKFNTVQILDIKDTQSHGAINKLLVVDEDRILIGTLQYGLKCYYPKSGTIKSLLISNKDQTEIYVRDILYQGKNTYWIATESGIYIYDLATNQSNNLKRSKGDHYSLSDNAVYCLAKDNSGGMWAGTYFGGLNYLSDETSRFKKYYPTSDPNSISGNAVREICGDDQNNIWIGTEDAGINKLNTKTGKITQFTSKGSAASLSYPNIHGMLAMGNELYLGPFQHGMEIMDINTGKIKDKFKVIGDTASKSDFVISIYKLKSGQLLVGTAGAGLWSYEHNTKTFSRLNHSPKRSHVFCILEDHNGTIWNGSRERGVFYFNPKSGASGNISFKDSGKRNIKDNVVQGVHEDKENNLWFATEGSGLVKLGADRKTIRKFTIANGLPTNYLFRILEDGHNNLWISSLKGLISFNTKTEKTTVYTSENGLITDQFNYNSAYKDIAGNMYFGSVKGLVVFNPDTFKQRYKTPPTYITGFQVNNRDISPTDQHPIITKSILFTDTIVLKHNQSNFNIEFAALSFPSASVTRYKYLMQGLDKNWTYLNSNRKAYFTDLSPGTYTFILKAESNVNNWAGGEQKLVIKILPPLWRSNAAYLCYFIIIALTVYFSVRYYHRSIEKKNIRRLRLYELKKEKEIYEAKIDFFTNIAHEIQTPLTLIIGPVEQSIRKTDEASPIMKSLLMIEKNANRLIDLTDQLLDFRKTEMNAFGLSFVNVDIAELLKEQIFIFGHHLENLKIDVSFNLEEPPLIAFVDRDAFTKITSNLISNAVKYADKKIAISLSEDVKRNQFTVLFTNDGKPIPAEFAEKIFEPFFRLRADEKPGTGIGLPLAKSLTELHDGTLKKLENENNLTIFELTLPIRQQLEFKLNNWKTQ